MDFNEVLKEVENSAEYKKFKQENEKAYLCALFFILDLKNNTTTKQVDFYMPVKNSVATFSLENNVTLKEEEVKNALEEINPEINVTLDKAVEIAKENAKGGINEIIAVLQVTDKKQIWNLTCMMDSLQMFRIKIEPFNGKILFKEKTSIFSLIKKQ